MEHREQTKIYMQDVRTYLKNKYKEIKPEWEISLDLLASTLDQYFDCCENINEQGIVVTGQRGLTVNPACTLKNQCQIRIEKMIAEFGLAARSAMKLTAEADDTEDLIADLVG